MQSSDGGGSRAAARDATRLSHCPQCSAAWDGIPVPSEGLPFFNFLIQVSCRLGNRPSAERWLRHVADLGLQPDVLTFLPLITLCAEEGDVDGIHHYLAVMSSLRVPVNACAMHGLMKGYVTKRDLPHAQQVMEMMKRSAIPITDFTYHVLLHGCAKTGHVAQAEGYVAEMESVGIQPVATTYNCLINVCSGHATLQRAEYWFRRMGEKGIEPNTVTYGTMCKAYAFASDVDSVEQMMAACEANGHAVGIHFYASWLLACERSRPRNKESAARCLRHLLQRGLSAERLFERFERLLGRGRARQVVSETQQARPQQGTAELDSACGELTIHGVLCL